MRFVLILLLALVALGVRADICHAADTSTVQSVELTPGIVDDVVLTAPSDKVMGMQEVVLPWAPAFLTRVTEVASLPHEKVDAPARYVGLVGVSDCRSQQPIPRAREPPT